MTSKNRVYPMVRLGEDETIIGKTVQVYEAKFLNGLRGFIILESDHPIDLSKTQVAEAETQAKLKQDEFERRISKLEKVIENPQKRLKLLGTV